MIVNKKPDYLMLNNTKTVTEGYHGSPSYISSKDRFNSSNEFRLGY
jgi:hypothetical protein